MVLKKATVKNQKGLVVLAALIFESDGEYYYSAFPVIGSSKYDSYRILLYKPLFTMKLPDIDATDAIRSFDERITKSSAHFIDDYSKNMNKIIWNGQKVGYIYDQTETSTLGGTVTIDYRDQISLYTVDSINDLIDYKQALDGYPDANLEKLKDTTIMHLSEGDREIVDFKYIKNKQVCP